MMNLLAIDTSTEIASIALLSGDKLLIEEQGAQRTHAQLLLPMIDRLMTQAGLILSDLDGVIFGCGPGSFTGLRIACSVAKGLAYAHDLDIIPVSSLDAIVWSVREYNEGPVLAVLDARMKEMYSAYYSDGIFHSEAQVSPVQEIILPEDAPVILAGVGIETYWAHFSQKLKNSVQKKLNLFPQAAAMISLVQHQKLKPISLSQAQPIYVRNKVTQS